MLLFDFCGKERVHIDLIIRKWFYKKKKKKLHVIENEYKLKSTFLDFFRVF